MEESSGLGIKKEELEALVAPIELGPASGKWVTAQEAIKFVEKKCLIERNEAIRAVCRRVPISVPVSCVSWTVGEDPHEFIDRVAYFREHKRTSDHFKRIVSRRAYDELLHFFEAIGNEDRGQGDWEIEYASWATGDFKVHLERDFSVVRLGVVGLQFDRVALERSFAGRSEAPANFADDAAPRSGGRPQSAAWPQWIAEIVHYIHENGYPAGEGAQGQEAIINCVADSLAERGLPCPSRSTVQASVQAVLDRFRHS